MINIRDNKGKIKTSAWIVGGATAVALAFGAYKIFVKKDKEKESADNILTETTDEINAKGTTITQAQAKEIANRLYNAMKDSGTDEDEIERLIIGNKLTTEDLKMVVLAFGTKKYGTFGSPLFDWMDGTSLNLREWLKKECSSSLMEKLNIKFDQAGFLSGMTCLY
ncbi:MAG: hypothetical protein MJZ30_09455 [Paludibacteraceae bacterium]|nr:hypothetical protein [Paludibacteraceae bacterium]